MTTAGTLMKETKPGWFLKVTLEVLLISVGVFLALVGDQWRERAHARELAEASLRRFRAEIVANRAAVSAVKDYHAGMLAKLNAYFDEAPAKRQPSSIRLEGVQPVFFQQTAWDLAIATQSLADIDSDVAFDLSEIYGVQRTYVGLTGGIMQAIYLRPIAENFEALRAYYGDIVLWEPRLLEMYDKVLPKIDRALGPS
jgi:hypothetical protein